MVRTSVSQTGDVGFDSLRSHCEMHKFIALNEIWSSSEFSDGDFLFVLDILMRCVYNKNKERHALHYFVEGGILWQARKNQKPSL